MKISIVTPTFNSAATLKDTLESILQQSYQDYEVLLQDAGSTDGTVDIAHAYLARFGERLKIVSAPDKGLYDGFNKGVRRATGDVVGVLNSDDFYTSNQVLETIVNAFDEHPDIDAVYADVHYVDSSDLSKPVRFYSSKKFSRKRMEMGYMPAHPTFYVRRECYEKYGYFDLDYKVAADFENLLRMIYVQNINTFYVEQDWVTMRTGGASSSGLKSHVRIIKDHFRAFRKNGVRVNPLKYFWRYVEKLQEFRLK